MFADELKTLGNHLARHKKNMFLDLFCQASSLEAAEKTGHGYFVIIHMTGFKAGPRIKARFFFHNSLVINNARTRVNSNEHYGNKTE